MGREIRRVPPGWEHPRQRCPHSPWRGGCDDALDNGGRCYRPLLDQTFEEAVAAYVEEKRKWDAGERKDWCKDKTCPYEEWAGPCPGDHAREYYRPYWPPEQATHYQVYETVSEGTPVTPVFATLDELVDYLAEHGDFWDQQPHTLLEPSKPRGGWGRENAEAFVRGGGWLPSLMMERVGDTVRKLEPKDMFPAAKPKRGVSFDEKLR